MHDELVARRRWIGEQRFLHALSYCTVLPGPEAQQLAIYLGWLLNGTLGGLIAGTLFVLPGYVVLMALSAIYAQWGNTRAVAAVLAGVSPAVLAIVAQAVTRLGRRAIADRWTMAVAVTAFVSLDALAVPFPVVIALAGLAGWAIGRWRPRTANLDPAPSSALGPTPVISDDELHQVAGSWRRALRLVVIGVVLWAAPVVAVAALTHSTPVFTHLAGFFSLTALVTFGGAYAVLSFVAQRAVSVYHWLSPTDMVNGLALAETTPGPLIMVVQFVGFLGAFHHPGPLNAWVAGVLGATLVVWVTFAPCFVMVFLGAPYVEQLRHNANLSAALSGVSAAVVGVIANLSVYFALHTWFSASVTRRWGPVRLVTPVLASVSPRALAVAVLAWYLVFRRRSNVAVVLGTCGLVGAAIYLASR